MGLSSLPAPSEGVLCILLVNTASFVSIFKAIIRSILHLLFSQIPAATPNSIENLSEPIDFHHDSPLDYYVERFRDLARSIHSEESLACKFPEHECSVCLTQFELKSELNQLSCGHLFHKMCLQKWLDYSNFTCPLCRSPLMAEEVAF